MIWGGEEWRTRDGMRREGDEGRDVYEESGREREGEWVVADPWPHQRCNGGMQKAMPLGPPTLDPGLYSPNLFDFSSILSFARGGKGAVLGKGQRAPPPPPPHTHPHTPHPGG